MARTLDILTPINTSFMQSDLMTRFPVETADSISCFCRHLQNTSRANVFVHWHSLLSTVASAYSSVWHSDGIEAHYFYMRVGSFTRISICYTFHRKAPLILEQSCLALEKPNIAYSHYWASRSAYVFIHTYSEDSELTNSPRPLNVVEKSIVRLSWTVKFSYLWPSHRAAGEPGPRGSQSRSIVHSSQSVPSSLRFSPASPTKPGSRSHVPLSCMCRAFPWLQ